ncbi:MAG: hypothetical protein SFW36_02625 [Leptolyngbyaceae cyanobacterium bins.59]|nr:hypothetical protein [Leptolyngbyaceae cyanobacterium bins.59]
MKTQLNTQSAPSQPTRSQSARSALRERHNSQQFSQLENPLQQSAPIPFEEEEQENSATKFGQATKTQSSRRVTRLPREKEAYQENPEQFQVHPPLQGHSSPESSQPLEVRQLSLPPFLPHRSPNPSREANPSFDRQAHQNTVEISLQEAADPRSTFSQAQSTKGSSRKAERGVSLSREEIEQHLATGIQDLETQVNYINQLSDDLEAALLGFKLVAAKVIQYRQRMGQFGEGAIEKEASLADYNSLVAAVPYIQQNKNGDYHLTVRQVDLLKAERDAIATAQFLRNRVQHLSQFSGQETKDVSTVAKIHSTHPSIHGLAKRSAYQRSTNSSRHAPQSSQRLARWRWLRSLLKVPQSPFLKGVDALVWLTVAAALRVSLQVFVSFFPFLLVPATLLLVTSALIAAYQTLFMARSGAVFGYRLFLLSVGFLLGGRV